MSNKVVTVHKRNIISTLIGRERKYNFSFFEQHNKGKPIY